MARYCIAIPTHKHLGAKKVLVFCHGCRPQGIELQADLDLTDGLYLSCLQEGWMVAMTSYRKEGRVIMEAIEDVALLLEYIRTQYGDQDMVFLEGQSMGGHLATLVAETRPDIADGVLTVGAALLPKADEIYPAFTYCPKIPLLHLTTASETTPLFAYVDTSLKVLRTSPPVEAVSPVCWVAQRQGHCNVNWIERMTAMRQLVGWVSTRDKVPQNKHFITVLRSPLLSRVCYDNPKIKRIGGAWGKVVRVDIYGDMLLNFQGYDLDQLGIYPLRDLSITVEIERQPNIRKTVQGFRYSEGDAFCPKREAGLWMVWENADGWIVLSRNMSAVSPLNAGDFLGAVRGSRIHLQAFTPARTKLNPNIFNFVN